MSREQLAEVVLAAASRYDDVDRAVRLVAARADGDLSQVREAVDRGLRTRRFLDYREASPGPERLIRSLPSSTRLPATRRRGIWSSCFRFADQDFFEVDPARYADALGERGLTEYRKKVAAADGDETFAVRYVRERLAILDKDLDAIVVLVGGDLGGPHRLLRVAEAMDEIGRLAAVEVAGSNRGEHARESWSPWFEWARERRQRAKPISRPLPFGAVASQFAGRNGH